MSEAHSGSGGGIRVFLLDDHEIVRRGIRELLETEPDIEVVGESGLAQEAARRIPVLRPDVAILDNRLPDGSGIDVCREIRSRSPELAALILTSPSRHELPAQDRRVVTNSRSADAESSRTPALPKVAEPRVVEG